MEKRKGNVNGINELLKLLKGFSDGGENERDNTGIIERLKLLKGFSDGGKKERECQW